MAQTQGDQKFAPHPWAFILKEGKEIKRDKFDYSLVMFRAAGSETLRSPQRSHLPRPSIPCFEITYPNDEE